MIRCSVLLIFILQSSLAYDQDTFLDSAETFYPDETFDGNIHAIDNSKKSNHFLRFGRNQEKYRSDYDYFGDFANPTRATKREKNDHFARFGRNQEFVRFGSDRQNMMDNEMYNRIGNDPYMEIYHHRSKREVVDEIPPKDDTYLRFGKNSNFVRFGRNQLFHITDAMNEDVHPHFNDNKFRKINLKHLIAELKRRQKDGYAF